MKESHTLNEGPITYRITILGCLDDAWSTWFDGLSIHCQSNGTTFISGPIVDQPALHGVLKKIRDLGIPLLAVAQLNEEDSECKGGLDAYNQ